MPKLTHCSLLFDVSSCESDKNTVLLPSPCPSPLLTSYPLLPFPQNPAAMPKLMHYGLLFEVNSYKFDKHWYYELDVTTCPPWDTMPNQKQAKKAGPFDHPPRISEVKEKVWQVFEGLGVGVWGRELGTEPFYRHPHIFEFKSEGRRVGLERVSGEGVPIRALLVIETARRKHTAPVHSCLLLCVLRRRTSPPITGHQNRQTYTRCPLTQPPSALCPAKTYIPTYYRDLLVIETARTASIPP